MYNFNDNIISMYGDKGREWLKNLPCLIQDMKQKWDLSDLSPLPNLAHNYVVSGEQGYLPIILKLSLDEGGLAQEAAALNVFAGHGAVRVIDYFEGALLLERADPGTSLRSYFPDREIESIEIAVQAISELHQATSHFSHQFPKVRDWLDDFDKSPQVPLYYLKKVKKVRDYLLDTSIAPVLLHGDLHHDNILMCRNRWIVIDPKGVMGEPCYEAAAFIRNPLPELMDAENLEEILSNRIEIFAKLLNLDPHRITLWCFVQTMLSWIWALEDNMDIAPYQRLTRIFYGLIR